MAQIIEWLNTFMMAECAILVPVLLILGVPLKMSKKVPDWIIIYVLIGIGCLGGLLLSGLSAMGAFQGIIAAAVACCMYQVYRQAQKAKEE